MGSIKLTLCLTIEGIEETVPLVVAYTHHKAWSGGGISPDEPAHCEVQSIHPDGTTANIDHAMSAALDRLTESDEFQALLAQDAFEDRVAAEEYRAEARAEMLRDDREGF